MTEAQSASMREVVPDAEQAYARLLAQLAPAMAHGPVLVVGIHSGGAWIAKRLAADLAAGGTTVETGFLSSAFHRDDYGSRSLPGSMKATELPLSIDARDILLVDDILYTGRTIRASLNELFDYGRPRSVRLAVLMDRGGRELPIQADFCGATLACLDEGTVRLAQQADGRFEVAFMEPNETGEADE